MVLGVYSLLAFFVFFSFVLCICINSVKCGHIMRCDS